MHGIKITREEIVSAIKEAYEKGLDLRTSKVQQSRYRRFYRSHRYYFDSWSEALKAAGFSYFGVANSAKEEKRMEFLSMLRDAYQAGADLSSWTLQRKDNPYRTLRYRAEPFYKGRFFWEDALRDAGLPVNKIVKQKRWDKSKIRERLLERAWKNKPINCAAVKVDEPDLYKAVCNCSDFASYDDALEFSGFDPKKIRMSGKSLGYDEIMDGISRMDHERSNLNEGDILDGDDRKLVRLVWSARRRFGGQWAGAVNAYGRKVLGVNGDYYDYFRKRNRWRPAKIIARLKTIASTGVPLTTAHFSEHHPDLLHAVYNWRMSWGKAMKQCGARYDTERRRWVYDK